MSIYMHMHTYIILPSVYVCTLCCVYDKAIKEEMNSSNT